LGVLLAAPNPMPGVTTLSWSLGATALVRLEVYAVNGRRVAVLQHGAMPAGVHSAIWSGRDLDGRVLANGVYHARLTVDGLTRATRRLVILRP
jgi:flagellar hook assembly protein FlgD